MLYLKKKRLVFYALTLLFIFSPYIFSQDHPYIVDKELLDIIQNEVSGERAWDIVSKITRFHRIRGGGKGSDYNRCAEWLAGELKKIELLEVSIKKYRADGSKKYFLWTSPSGWRVKEAELWLLEPQKKFLARFSDQALSLMPYSQGGEVEAEVIYVGEGKSDDDYKDKDVKGKLVFASGGGGNQVHLQAVLKRGAAGIIVGPSYREDRLEYPDLIEKNSLSPTRKGKAKTGFGFSISRRQEKELLSFFKAKKKVKMRAKVDAELFDGNMPFLEAKITGQEYPEQEVIILAHLDHYKPGANDNASGSAGMVEMARNIADLIKRGDIPPLKRTLRFLWVPENVGTLAYLSEHQDLKSRGIAGINLEGIGNDCVLTKSTFNLVRSAYSVPGYINDVLANLLGWLEYKNFFSPRGSRHLFSYIIEPYTADSDHKNFNDSTFSIPMCMLVHHADVLWHTNLDTPDKCDPTQLKRGISLALAASLCLVNADDEDALKIAQEVYAQAKLRMTIRTQKSIRMLHQCVMDPEKRKDLAELYTTFIAYPQLQAKIEAANIKEVKELSTNETTKAILDKLAENVSSQAKKERETIDSFYAIYLRRYNLKEKKFHLGGAYIKASALKPKRRFKGPLPRNFLREKIGEKDFLWYEKYRKKHEVAPGQGGTYGSKLNEIVNLMDGQRTLVDIRHILSFEFDETDIELVLHYAQDLERTGLITY